MNGRQQLELFAPSPAVETAVREAMNRAARESGLSREQIVDRMETLAVRHGIRLNTGSAAKLTVQTLEKWLNPVETERMIPIKALEIFCLAIPTTAPMAALVAPLGMQLIDRDDALKLEWAKDYFEIKHRRERMRKLEREGKLL